MMAMILTIIDINSEKKAWKSKLFCYQWQENNGKQWNTNSSWKKLLKTKCTKIDGPTKLQATKAALRFTIINQGQQKPLSTWEPVLKGKVHRFSLSKLLYLLDGNTTDVCVFLWLTKKSEFILLMLRISRLNCDQMKILLVYVFIVS